MKERLGEWGSTLKSYWQDWSVVKRATLILAILSVLIVGIVTYRMVSAVEYSVLFSDISEQDAGTITQDLQKQNIKYKLDNNGKTILIEKDKVDEYRINLAVDNKLPNSTTGFELFDNASMMTTDEDRKIMYQRAVTGELQRAIESLSDVEKAKVLLVMPDKSVFQDQAQPATASVVLTLKKPTISASAVQGIVNLVSGGVENLSPENVKIVDSNGRTLTSDTSDETGVAGMSDRYSEIKHTYEKGLEDKLKALLEPIYGDAGYQVSVNLDLNFDASEKTTVTYGDTAIRSENVQATGSQGDIEEAQTGTLDDNVTNVTGDNTGDGTKTYERSVNNEVNTETTKTVSAPSAITRMTSSIVINKSLNAAEEQNLQQLVETAIGYNQDRGDVLSIQGMRFATTQETTDTEITETETSFVQRWLPYLIIGAVVIVAIIGTIVFFIMRRRRQDEYEEYEFTNEGSQFDMLVTDEEDSETAKPVDNDMQTKAKTFADKNPELAADLIKAWMKEK